MFDASEPSADSHSFTSGSHSQRHSDNSGTANSHHLSSFGYSSLTAGQVQANGGSPASKPNTEPDFFSLYTRNPASPFSPHLHGFYTYFSPNDAHRVSPVANPFETKKSAHSNSYNIGASKESTSSAPRHADHRQEHRTSLGQDGYSHGDQRNNAKSDASSPGKDQTAGPLPGLHLTPPLRHLGHSPGRAESQSHLAFPTPSIELYTKQLREYQSQALAHPSPTFSGHCQPNPRDPPALSLYTDFPTAHSPYPAYAYYQQLAPNSSAFQPSSLPSAASSSSQAFDSVRSAGGHSYSYDSSVTSYDHFGMLPSSPPPSEQSGYSDERPTSSHYSADIELDPVASPSPITDVGQLQKHHLPPSKTQFYRTVVDFPAMLFAACDLSDTDASEPLWSSHDHAGKPASPRALTGDHFPSETHGFRRNKQPSPFMSDPLNLHASSPSAASGFHPVATAELAVPPTEFRPLLNNEPRRWSSVPYPHNSKPPGSDTTPTNAGNAKPPWSGLSAPLVNGGSSASGRESGANSASEVASPRPVTANLSRQTSSTEGSEHDSVQSSGNRGQKRSRNHTAPALVTGTSQPPAEWQRPAQVQDQATYQLNSPTASSSSSSGSSLGSALPNLAGLKLSTHAGGGPDGSNQAGQGREANDHTVGQSGPSAPPAVPRSRKYSGAPHRKNTENTPSKPSESSLVNGEHHIRDVLDNKEEKTVFVDGGKKLYQCRICARQFPRPSALVVHERIHSGEKPFTCEYCGRPFTVASNLRRHQKIHQKQAGEADEKAAQQDDAKESSAGSTVKAPPANKQKTFYAADDRHSTSDLDDGLDGSSTGGLPSDEDDNELDGSGEHGLTAEGVAAHNQATGGNAGTSCSGSSSLLSAQASSSKTGTSKDSGFRSTSVDPEAIARWSQWVGGGGGGN